MSDSEKFEDDLIVAMSRTGEGFEPDRADQAGLVAGGYERGRRRWRRRSATAVVGGAVALALVGGGAFYLTGTQAKNEGAAVAAAPATAPATSAITPASAPSKAAATEAPPVSGDEVLAAFKALLPAGQTTDAHGTGTEPSSAKPNTAISFANATLVFDDGHGKAAMGISLARLAENNPNRAENTCPDRKLVPYEACATTTTADGGTLTVFQGWEYADRHVSTRWWYAKLIGKDGRQIELSEWNAPAEKGAPDSRPTPPLSPEQLKAIVTDGSWDKVIASMPLPKPVKMRDADKEYTGQEILDITAKLLPSGLKETETSADGTGYANFVVNDGKGKSLVQLNVQDWSRDQESGKLFAGAETKPDGSKVIVRKEGGNPGMWTVDTLHPDGLRVVISSFNSGTQKTPATRTAPVLTDEQMKVIALDPVWKLKK